MGQISAVVFDIGNVLVRWQPDAVYERVMSREERVRMYAETGIEAVNIEVDRGAPFRESIYGLADQHPAWAEPIRMWHDSWQEMAAPEIPHSVRLLRALRQNGVPVFALTNFGRETFALAQTMYPFLTEFDRAYVSAHLGLIKPDPAIYAAVEADSGFAPDTLLFADDKAENIEAAEARGWAGHLFTEPEGFARRLVAEGLLSEEEAA